MAGARPAAGSLSEASLRDTWNVAFPHSAATFPRGPSGVPCVYSATLRPGEEEPPREGKPSSSRCQVRARLHSSRRDRLPDPAVDTGATSPGWSRGLVSGAPSRGPLVPSPYLPGVLPVPGTAGVLAWARRDTSNPGTVLITSHHRKRN